MAEEKIVTLNLRKEIKKATRWKKSKIIVKLIREKIKRISKAEEVKIDSSVNKKIWSRGIEKPPAKLRLKIVKTDEKTAKVELV